MVAVIGIVALQEWTIVDPEVMDTGKVVVFAEPDHDQFLLPISGPRYRRKWMLVTIRRKNQPATPSGTVFQVDLYDPTKDEQVQHHGAMCNRREKHGEAVVAKLKDWFVDNPPCVLPTCIPTVQSRTKTKTHSSKNLID
ncbi:hypothetical protein PG984_014133 [Apiospora sp. TS-2023a]